MVSSFSDGFAEGEVSKQTDKYAWQKHYQPPHYFAPDAARRAGITTLTLIANDLEPTALSAALTRARADQGADGHAKGATG